MFGVWADPDAAEALYDVERQDWEAGRNPRVAPLSDSAKSLLELADRWLLARRALLTVNDPAERIERITYKGSEAAMKKLLAVMGQRTDAMAWSPDDFAKLRIKLGEGVSPSTKGQRIMYVRAMFDWAISARLIAHLPDYGRKFENVTKGEKERHRYDYQKEHGERVFHPDEARRILKAAEDAVDALPHKCSGAFVRRRDRLSALMMRACHFLAANTGANSKDIAHLTLAEIDLNAGYVERVREKTGILWQATLWRETVSYIRAYLRERPTPARPEWAQLVFLTSEGFPVNHGDVGVEAGEKNNRTDVLRQNTSKLLRKLGLKERGVTFGAWRSTFRSLASDAMGVRVDAVHQIDAINRIMAHALPGVAGRYVKLKPEQLRPYTEAVRAKLLPGAAIALAGAGTTSSGSQYPRLVS